MKVNGVSSAYFKAEAPQGALKDISNPFLYTANDNYKPKYTFKAHRKEYLAGAAALAIAIISLTKFMGRNTTPKSVVELVDKTAGLNIIEGAQRTVKQLKDMILYPMMSVDLGERKLLRGHNFKTGLILIDEKGGNKAEKIMNAFLDHADKIGIHCEKIRPHVKDSEMLKAANKALEAAENYYKETGKCVIVNLGNLGKFSKQDPSRFDAYAKIDKRLRATQPGVLWTAWTNEPHNLSYYYNRFPVLMSKIVE